MALLDLNGLSSLLEIVVGKQPVVLGVQLSGGVVADVQQGEVGLSWAEAGAGIKRDAAERARANKIRVRAFIVFSLSLVRRNSGQGDNGADNGPSPSRRPACP